MRLSWSFKAIGRTPKFCFMVHHCTLNRKYLCLQERNKEKRYTKRDRERGGEAERRREKEYGRREREKKTIPLFMGGKEID